MCTFVIPGHLNPHNNHFCGLCMTGNFFFFFFLGGGGGGGGERERGGIGLVWSGGCYKGVN